MPDLSTTYLGLRLTSPLVASPGPLCKDIGHVRHMAEAGVAAVVLHSLFEEQIELGEQGSGAARSAEPLSYFLDELASPQQGADSYLSQLNRVKEAAGIPVIGSLNGFASGGWVRYAKRIEDAGADALELNLYYMPASVESPGIDIERMFIELVREVKSSVKIPVAVKLGPFFSSIPHMARQLEEAGADGLVLFNRFYQPDFDIETRKVTASLALSGPNELLLRLHWVALLHGHIRPDMAITGGVSSAEDVLKAMMAGAKVAMMTSALLREGIDHVTEVNRELLTWLEQHEIASIEEIRGAMSVRNVSYPDALERANYIKVLAGYDVRTFLPTRLDEDRLRLEERGGLTTAEKLVLYMDLYH